MNDIFAITTGDIDGIGLEITLKSLFNLGPQKNTCFIIYRSVLTKNNLFKKLESKFLRVQVNSLQEALKFYQNNKDKKNLNRVLMDIASDLPPAFWVEEAAIAALNQDLQGIITGPISKTEILKSGLKDMGHTGILKRVCQVKDVHMGFIGDKFNVSLVTDHIPLTQVNKKLNMDLLKNSLLLNWKFFSTLNKSKAPIALLGLNPHSGEEGLLGDFEDKNKKELVKFCSQQRIPADLFVVPDSAFIPANQKKYCCFLALYHDQGLAPFKACHGQDGVHVTVGLPIIRTSVDHGTAKDLFGKNKASFKSMELAILFAIKLQHLKKFRKVFKYAK